MKETSPTRIHHLGHAVEDLEGAARFYRSYLGARPTGEPEEVAEQGVVALMLRVGDGENIELLQPTRPDSPVGKFLLKNGEGLHHVAFEVRDIEAALAEHKGGGFEPLDGEPRTGAGGSRVAFLSHPKHALGVLVELVQRKNGEEKF